MAAWPPAVAALLCGSQAAAATEVGVFGIGGALCIRRYTSSATGGPRGGGVGNGRW
jgi:hypothetical protein